MRKFAAALLCGSAFLVTGCFDIEQSITLERNLSGQAGFSMKVDMEPLVRFMAQMKNEMSGKKGAPTAAELAEIRKELMSPDRWAGPTDFEKEKKEIASKLPQGRHARRRQFSGRRPEDDGAGDVRLRPRVEARADLAAQQGRRSWRRRTRPRRRSRIFRSSMKARPSSSPCPVENPTSDAPGPGRRAPDAEMMKQMEALFKGLRVAFKITAPFEVVEHNAHRKTGNTLIWEYDLATMQKLTPEQANRASRVRYRK